MVWYIYCSHYSSIWHDMQRNSPMCVSRRKRSKSQSGIVSHVSKVSLCLSVSSKWRSRQTTSIQVSVYGDLIAYSVVYLSDLFISLYNICRKARQILILHMHSMSGMPSGNNNLDGLGTVRGNHLTFMKLIAIYAQVWPYEPPLHETDGLTFPSKDGILSWFNSLARSTSSGQTKSANI